MENHNFKTGDLVKIIDSRGNSLGAIGDIGKVLYVRDGDMEADVVTCSLLTGKHKGLEFGRCAFRLEKTALDWDE